MPNAANTAAVARRLREAAPAGVRSTDEHQDLAVLAVQGPRSAEVLTALGLPTEPTTWHFADGSCDGVADSACAAPATPASTATSCWCPPDAAPAVWDALMAAGEPHGGCRPAWPPATRCAPRWATRCTGRTCRPEITPVQARQRLGGRLGKPEFWGREALLAEKAAGPAPAAARAAGDRPGRPAAGTWRCCAEGARGRRDHSRHVLADAEGGHRAGAARHGVRRWTRATR